MRIEGNRLVKEDPRVQNFDFNSVAKGYSEVDLLADLVERFKGR